MITVDTAPLRASWRAFWSPRLSLECTGAARGWLLLWAFLHNSAVALLFALPVWGLARDSALADVLVWSFVIAQCIGFSIHALFRLGARILGPARLGSLDRAARLLFYVGIPIAGVFIGYALALALLGRNVVQIVAESPRVLLAIIVIALAMSLLAYRLMADRARLAEAAAAQQRERARALQAEKQALDAQLRGLQAQVEPHFLFNTLANVASLIDGRPVDARRMLERLIELLRASLQSSRAPQSTLGQEFDLLRAYLDILAIRMGTRLAFSIDAPPELREVALPPLLVQPLVENAIRHGLEPKVGGGRVAVTARADGDDLLIEVADDGQGFGATTAAGVGLANLRERLAALYGARGRLTIEDALPGTRARVRIPRSD